MTAIPPFLRRASAVVSERAGAAIAVVLIVVALYVGYRIGRPAAPPEEPAPSATTAASTTMYTCSMHPSVRLPDPDAKCPICFMDLIPVTDDGGDEARLVLDEAALRASGIETAPVRRFLPFAEVRLYGKLTYDETSVARITAYFPGRLDRLFVNYVGVPVAKGDHLAEIYSPELITAFGELREARLAHDESRTSSPIVRESNERTLDAARRKLRLLGLTEQQVADAEAGTATEERLTMYTPMAGIVTDLAAREGDYVETGTEIATVADLSHLWLDLEAYESQLPLLRWGQPVEFTVEAHPGARFEGRVSFIEPIVDARTRTAAVRVAVDNADRTLKPGMFASAVVRPRVAAGGAVVSDELAGRWVSPMHPTIVKDGPGSCDVCGMDLVPAESLGIVGDPSAVEIPLVIPRTAAMLTGRRAVVYVKVPGVEAPTFEGREVVLGPRAGDLYIVEEGLAEGEQVVVHGAFRVDSAMQILARPSMMTAPDESDERADHGPAHFLAQLEPVYTAYIDLQEALAADDAEGFANEFERLEDAVGAVETTGLVGDALGAWRRAAGRLVPETAPVTIDEGRTAFEPVSRAMIELVQRFGHGGDGPWQIVHCPMAFDDTGADWIQRSGKVINPYFGAAMLRCGAVKETLEPRAGAHEGHDHD